MNVRRTSSRLVWPAPPFRGGAERRGTVIVVVIALLGALMLLGFLFLTLTMQEEQGSYNFSKAHDLPAEKDPDVFFNWALEQVIVGPPDEARNSILYGGYKSLMPNMVGGDLTPFDGQGVGTAWSTVNNRPELDLNRDGNLDGGDQFALQMTFAAGSQFGTLADLTTVQDFYSVMRTDPSLSRLPTPDADFTYPDLNSAFLAYDWIEPTTGLRVVIPSFHRPQLLRNRIPPSGLANNDYLLDPDAGEWDNVGGTTVHPWYTRAETLPYVMRPHLQRRSVAVNPENSTSYSVLYQDENYARRFVTEAYPDSLATNDPNYIPPLDLSVNREPMWRVGAGDAAAKLAGDATGDVDAAAVPHYADSYDADPDNDGVFDAIWLDLDFPIQNAGDGAGQFVPMFALKIIDVDALFNLNAHGNSYGSYADADANGVDDSLTLQGAHYNGNTAVPSISQSGPGRTPDEVNPGWALSGHNTATSGATADEVQAFSEFFDTAWSGGPDQSRNLEWWFLLHGRATFKTDPRSGARVPDDLLVGRYGESDRLEDGAGLVIAGDPQAAAYFPYPGLSANSLNVAGAGDDNYNSLEGMGRPLPGLVYGGARGYNAGAGLQMVAFAEGVPLDRRGSGFDTDAFRGLRRLFLVDTNAAINTAGTQAEDGNVRFRFPTYMNAVLPLFPAGGGPAAGFSNVGVFQVMRNWFATTGLFEGRTFTNSAYALSLAAGTGAPQQGTATAPLVGRGAAGASLAKPSNGATGAVADGTPLTAGDTAPSSYGALTGQLNAVRQFNRLQVDDPAETIRDFDLAQSQTTDALFGPAETARLHMSDADYRIAKTSSRLLELAPVSFAEAPKHELIRQRFTTVSWDVATSAGRFEAPVAGIQSPGATDRDWENSQLTAADVPSATNPPRVFPPVFGGTYGDANDPFRAEVRAILAHAARNVEINNPAQKRVLRGLVRKLSFNAVAERVTNPADPLFDRTAAIDVDGDGTDDGQGELRLRTLTPHPTQTSGATPQPFEATEVLGPVGHPALANYKNTTGSIPRFGISDEGLRSAALASPGTGLLTWDFSNINGQQALRAQEWHARRDRQNLARDIYVLLYTVGGVNPTNATLDYTGDNAGHAIYSEEQLREMAQLAVNVVDAMDPDPVRTLFVYDKDLSNGYTYYDDGYANPPGPTAAGRGMVVGVERQEVAISEALANITWAEENFNQADASDRGNQVNHVLTEWDDSGVATGGPQDFLFLELAYTGPGELNFAEHPVTDEPGENYRIIVRDPRDTRQFREDAGALGQSGMQARAIIPRAGKLTAARPYYTIANANDGYIDGSPLFNTAAARSRMRVNLSQTKASVGAVGNASWITLAPQPFATNARQTDNDPANGEVLRDTLPANDAQILDTLVTGPDANDPTFWMQHLNNDLTATLRANPGVAGQNDLFSRVDPSVKPERLDQTPVVEVLLQTRLNPLRAPKESDPTAADYADEDRDNPWITVDRTRVVTTRLDIFDQDDNGGVTRGDGAFGGHFVAGGAVGGPIEILNQTNATPKVASRVRMEPLLRASELAAVGRTNAERSLLDTSDRATAEGYGPVIFNSIGGHDRNSPGGHAGQQRPFSLWQPHFDREFAGPADLIGVPLYDSESLAGLTATNDRAFGSGMSDIKKTAFQEFASLSTQNDRQIGLGFDPTPQDATQTVGAGNDAILNEFNVVGSRLLYPDVARKSWQDPLIGAAGTEHLNSWYRLLQYVGTPRRTSEMIDAAAETVQIGPTARLGTDGAFSVGSVRRAGRINFNTLRHPHVLAGVIDDPRVHDDPGTTLPMRNATFTPAAVGLGAFNSDLYGAMLLSRDGRDPLVTPGVWGDGASRAVLPGIALRGMAEGGGMNGNPFTGYHNPTRSLDDGAVPDAAVSLREAMQSTPLRLRPQAAPWIGTGSTPLNGNNTRTSALPRAFFGVGAENVNAQTGDGGNNPADLDFTTRYRLLNKVLNSATHRSNVFLCFVQVDFFQARELRLGDVNPSAADPEQRFTRIGAKRGDSPRYRGVFLIDRSKAPALLRADHLPTTGNAGENTYSFARDPLSGGVRFPWQDLIIHRQRIQ
ncbi:hypothetical protein [Alienimonas chondri]|uniref:Tyrosinase copper-binding domain-containing protein n=1 Tax=Alienimonas chondri TaxID=2681879 RepID=A0ABX1VCF5_9PLAN|nr:hypothetical protein [Alienimonas chondri]NNJ25631.1 hypothetical protein [Alienimonas chondri]